MNKNTPKSDDDNDALARMDKALKAALSTPPTKHKDELKKKRKKQGSTSIEK